MVSVSLTVALVAVPALGPFALLLVVIATIKSTRGTSAEVTFLRGMPVPSAGPLPPQASLPLALGVSAPAKGGVR